MRAAGRIDDVRGHGEDRPRRSARSTASRAPGLKLDVVDIAELSLRNVAKLLETDERGAAFLYLSARRSTLLLVRQGVLYLARHVETGVATLAEAGELRPELVAGLALEVRRSLDYFESHYEQTSIPQLHVTGLENADREQLARELGIAVREVELQALFETRDAVRKNCSDSACRRLVPRCGTI